MAMAIKIENESYQDIEKRMSKECRKFEKYFLASPRVDCRILNFNKGVVVKISLDSGAKHFRGEAHGMQVDLCINKAVKRLIRLIESDKDILLRRGSSISLKQLNLQLIQGNQTL